MTTLKYTADRTRGNNLSCNRDYRYRSARCAPADFRGSFVDVMSVTCLFFFFLFFLQFFGRLGELVDLQRYGLCEIFESKADSKGLRN